MERGVAVVLMTRHLTDPDSVNARLVSRLRNAARAGTSLVALQLSSARFEVIGRELLHAKVLVVDGGRQGYVGSANLTGSGLSEALEIGVVLGGTAAGALASLVDDIAKLGQYA
jgi:phosphatidylserine/phosphatidylglycerophosphate/cardiolipin synthase-like enzyme